MTTCGDLDNSILCVNISIPGSFGMLLESRGRGDCNLCDAKNTSPKFGFTLAFLVEFSPLLFLT